MGQMNIFGHVYPGHNNSDSQYYPYNHHNMLKALKMTLKHTGII